MQRGVVPNRVEVVVNKYKEVKLQTYTQNTKYKTKQKYTHTNKQERGRQRNSNNCPRTCDTEEGEKKKTKENTRKKIQERKNKPTKENVRKKVWVDL